MSDILAIVQARNGSTRLPNKSLLKLASIPLLTHVLRRVKASKWVQDICLAIPNTPDNDALEAIGKEESVQVYRGDEKDVLARYYWAAELTAPECQCIVRITADDPFKDPALIDLAIETFLGEWAKGKELQYLHLGGESWALGADVEVFTRDALIAAFKNAFLPMDREHVTPYLERQYGKLIVGDPAVRRTSEVRHTIDTLPDYAYALKVYDRLYPINPLFSYAEVCEAGF